MRIISTKGEFDLYPDFETTFMQTNVMLTTAGEQTQPITLPPTRNNLMIVGFSNRIENIYKPLSDMEVYVSDELFNRACNMGIHTVDDEEGISCTLYFDSGSFYSKLNNTKISALPWPEWRNYGVNSIIQILKRQYIDGDAREFFYVAPVLTSQNYTLYVTKYPRQSNQPVEISGLFMLNGLERYNSYLDISMVNDFWRNFEGEYVQSYKEGSNRITISRGYGMTPFLRLEYVLNTVFEFYNFAFDHSGISRKITNYNRICLLNNVADAIYTGTLKCKDLFPDVTIKEFLTEVEKLLAGKFIFDEVNKRVTFYFFSDVLEMIPDIDLSPYLLKPLKTLEPGFTQIILSDSNSPATVEVDPREDVPESETLEFNFTQKKKIECETHVMSFDSSGDAMYEDYPLVRLDMVDIGGIIHKYTQVIIEGEDNPKKEKNNASKNILFGQLKQNCRTSPDYAQYNAIYNVFSDLSDSDIELAQNLYSVYMEFRANSNIPVEGEFKIPNHILEQLKLYAPKMINGQRLMIESINRKLGKDDTQVIKFRTLRSYRER